ncbi:MAG TPA: lipopolysaccharide assembly protein LapA domain-containing protein [Propionicimonas sp.]|jgi:uncharacterized integral membrane protein
MPQDFDPSQESPTVDAPASTAGGADPAGSLAPTTDAGRRSRSRAAWLALVVGVIVLIFMLVFILQNNVPTQFTFLAWDFTIPLGVAVLFAGIGGALITAMVGTIRMVVLGRNVRRLERTRTSAA